MLKVLRAAKKYPILLNCPNKRRKMHLFFQESKQLRCEGRPAWAGLSNLFVCIAACTSSWDKFTWIKPISHTHPSKQATPERKEKVFAFQLIDVNLWLVIKYLFPSAQTKGEGNELTSVCFELRFYRICMLKQTQVTSGVFLVLNYLWAGECGKN